MKRLSSVSLRQCTVIPPDGLPDNLLHSGAALSPERVHHTAPLLGGLRALRCVELVAMPHLRDADFRAIGHMTALTSLLVCASGNVQVGAGRAAGRAGAPGGRPPPAHQARACWGSHGMPLARRVAQVQSVPPTPASHPAGDARGAAAARRPHQAAPAAVARG